jgi:hypothetical protein
MCSNHWLGEVLGNYARWTPLPMTRRSNYTDQVLLETLQYRIGILISLSAESRRFQNAAAWYWTHACPTWLGSRKGKEKTCDIYAGVLE